MPWKRIKKEEVSAWNDKLQQTQASFSQYPYYTLSEQRFRLSRAIFIVYTENEVDLAFATIAEIGIFPCKVGIIEGGPIPLSQQPDIHVIIEDLKKFARDRRYIHLQVRPLNGCQETWFKADPLFLDQILFPFHQKEEFDLNIFNLPEKKLLASFKGQCRRKIVLGGRVPYEFRKIEAESELKYIFALFRNVAREKGYHAMPFPVFQKLFRDGKKHNLCDIYAACLDNEIINAVLIVKDARSYYHLSSALLIKGFREGESPSAKLHYFIMQDCFFREKKEYYNISYGGSDNLLRFKELFNPVQIEKPHYYTYVVNKTAVSFFQKISRERATFLRSNMKKLRELISAFAK